MERGPGNGLLYGAVLSFLVKRTVISAAGFRVFLCFHKQPYRQILRQIFAAVLILLRHIGQISVAPADIEAVVRKRHALS